MLGQIPAPMIGSLAGLVVFAGLFFLALALNAPQPFPMPVPAEPPPADRRVELWHDRLDELIDEWLDQKNDHVSDPVPDHEHPPVTCELWAQETGYRGRHSSTRPRHA